jgi:hypothetical protein
MTGDQSRTLIVDWDDGHTTSIQHNDMAQVERVPVKV